MKFSNTPVAHIHVDAIQHNLNQVRLLAPKCKIMAVVKADAYGHGAATVCQQLSGVDAYAVGRVQEGHTLRSYGVKHDIIVLEGFIDAAERQVCLEDDLTPTIHSEYQLNLIDREPVWLKVDTGMNRLGFDARELRRFGALIKEKKIVGIMSHLANSDVSSNYRNQTQMTEFEKTVEALALDVDLALANSGAILGLRSSHHQWVRPGVMLYGGSPFAGLTTPSLPIGESFTEASRDEKIPTATEQQLKAAMTLTAPIVAINVLKAGDEIGYGSTWRAEEDCRVAVVGIGYADGYPRETVEGTPVLIQSQRRSLVGRVSMDMSFVKLAASDSVDIGERVVLWGPELPIDEIGKGSGTTCYTLMTGLTNRVRKSYGEE